MIHYKCNSGGGLHGIINAGRDAAVKAYIKGGRSVEDRIEIVCRVSGQELCCDEKPDIYTGQQNYIRLKFEFDALWESITPRTAVFSCAREAGSISVSIPDDRTVPIPWEMMEEPGVVYVSVYGGDRMTTNRIGFAVYRSGYEPEAGTPKEPTEDAVSSIFAAAAAASGALMEHEQSTEAHQDIRQSINDMAQSKVDKVEGKGLSSNDYTDADKAKVDALGGNGTRLELDDGAGNALTLDADGDLLVDTTRTSPADPTTSGKTLGYKAALDTLTNVGNNTRGATISLKRRLSGEDQSLTTYLLTTGLIEIRTGTTAELNNSASGVQTTFSSAMSGTPSIVLLQPLSGQTGVAAPKIVSKSATGFYATLGGSTGTSTKCEYLAIRFNYMTQLY